MRVVNALRPVQYFPANAEDAPSSVVNGISTQSSPVVTVAPTTDRIPGLPGKSTIICGGGLVTYPEQELEDEPAPMLFEDNRLLPELKSLLKRVVTPTLATLERAVSARIYFETFYNGECAARSLDCLKTLKLPLARCIWRCVFSERTNY